MKVVITGGTGFTGSQLSLRLLKLGHKVVCLDTDKGIFHDELVRNGAQVILGSVTDKSLMESITVGADRVYHLAAAFRKINLPKNLYWKINVEGTRNVLIGCQKNGVERVVYCSTCGVHGNVGRRPADENSPIAPADYYQYTKYEGERVCEEFIRDGMWISILRPAAIYGPGDPERFYMIFKKAAGGSFIMLGDGTTFYHPLYIDSLVDAFLLASEKNEAKGRAYLIADRNYIPLNELIEGVAGALNVNVRVRRVPFWPVYAAAWCCEMLYKPFCWEPPIFRRRVDWFRQNRAFDISRAVSELGYNPSVDLTEGLKRTAQWYRQKGML